MRKPNRVTYLVLLAVGAIEDHMARPHPGQAPNGPERVAPQRALPPLQPAPRGDLTR